MQVVTVSPGFLPDTLYIAAPASLSLIVTEPVANVLAVFEVVPENAAKVENPAAVPTTPTTQNVRRSFWILLTVGSFRAFSGGPVNSTGPR